MGNIELELNGKLYRADYSLDENVVTVYGDRGYESTQLGGLSEQQVAKMLLRNLIKKGHVAPVDEPEV
ncbi:hypothetical protein [uncultured Salinisphaera sp.]|uniref:hypothetical protein n=1 Tax=uncultured Salinisphaera sp. TaxID=359372 RepID=UPI0032B124FE|tara:strand:- start:1648 stop:1851 length:204 start_codon:yes stop_codon:yes gene_type:complete